MKYILFIAALLSAGYASAQEGSGGFHSMMAGISGAYSKEFRYIHGGSNGIVIDQRNDREITIDGFDLGFNIGFNMNPGFGVETGLHYARRGFNSKDVDLHFSGNDPNEPKKLRSLKEFDYLSIPLKANIWFGHGNLRLIAGLGANLDFLLNGKVTTTYTYVNEATSKEDESGGYDFRKIGFSPMASIGMDLRVQKNNYLRLEPFIRYDVIPVTKTSIKNNLWGYGVRLAYMYGF